MKIRYKIKLHMILYVYSFFLYSCAISTPKNNMQIPDIATKKLPLDLKFVEHEGGLHIDSVADRKAMLCHLI